MENWELHHSITVCRKGWRGGGGATCSEHFCRYIPIRLALRFLGSQHGKQKPSMAFQNTTKFNAFIKESYAQFFPSCSVADPDDF
jgi:hypothetical protein